MSGLLEVKGLKKHFPVRRSWLSRLLARRGSQVLRAVDGIDLAVAEGETLGIVGESGCGKSTLGRTILRLHEATAGEIRFGGRDVRGLNGAGLAQFRQEAQVIFQNPYASLNPRKTVRQTLEVALSMRGVSKAERRDEVVQLLERCGLAGRHLDRYPHQFSGGQRQRIGIARALAMHPRFVVADEPVSALDVSVQAQIINLLQDLQAEFKLTYLFISHDLSVVQHISDRVGVMYVGKLVELGGGEAFFAEPLHPYSQALLSAAPGIKRTRERIILSGSPPSPLDPPEGCPFHSRCPAVLGEVCRRETPALREVSPGRLVACHLY